MLSVRLIPIFKDNYVFLITKAQDCVLVDPGEASAALQVIESERLNLKGLLITHHHSDHIDGIDEIYLRHKNIQIFAPEKNKKEIPKATRYINDGDEFNLMNSNFKVIGLSGHTHGHVAYYNSQEKILFSGDVLFGMGCGRLFEGTANEMFNSLNKIKMLPAETKVFCTHEYTERNLNFCENALKHNNSDLMLYKKLLIEKRNLNLPSVPLILSDELKVNPFLNCHSVEQFAELRELRNKH